MRFFRLLTHICSTLTLSFVFFLLMWHFHPFTSSATISASPLPDFLSLYKNKQVKLLDLWLPFIPQTHVNGFDVSDLTAQSVLVFDLTSGKMIFEKNARQRLAMASLTKIMTAIVSLENKRHDDTYL